MTSELDWAFDQLFGDMMRNPLPWCVLAINTDELPGRFEVYNPENTLMAYVAFTSYANDPEYKTVILYRHGKAVLQEDKHGS